MINFPDSPTEGQIYTDSGSGLSWQYTDGRWVAASAAAAAPLDLLFTVTGRPSNGEKLIPDTILPACSFPSGAAGSTGTAEVAATGSTTITASKNGAAFATFVWSAAGSAATVTIGSTTTFNGTTDKLSLDAPATADATLADIGLHLAGSRA